MRLLQNASDRASRMIESAAEKRARAEEEARALLEEARREGFEQGLKDAEEAVRREFSELLGALQTSLDEMIAYRERLMASEEEALLGFALAVAAKMTRQAFEDPDATKELARSYLAELTAEGPVVVKLPVQAKEWLPQRSGEHQVEVQIDPELGPGDVVIETDGGGIDARLGLRWERLVRAMAEEVGADA